MSGRQPCNLKHTMFCADKASHLGTKPAVSYWIMTNLTSLLQWWCWLRQENIMPGYRRQVCKLDRMAENIPNCKNVFQSLKSQPSLDFKSLFSQLWGRKKTHSSNSCPHSESLVNNQANIEKVMEDLTRNMSTACELHLLFQESFITHVVCISVVPGRLH